MPIVENIVAITGKYTDRSGQEKLKYENVGVVIEKDGKRSIKMTKLVVIDDSGAVVNWFKLYPPKDRQPARTERPVPTDDPDDSIPF